MKKTKKKQSKFPKKPIIIIATLLVVGGVAAYLIYRAERANRVANETPLAAQVSSTRPQNSVNYNPPTPEQQQQQQDTKTQVITQDTQPSVPASSISVTISRADQGTAGLPLNVRTIITGASSGTCTVTLTKSGQPTVTKTFSVVAQTNYYTCDQADIPAADFSVSGDWALSVAVSGSGLPTATTTGSVTIAK